MESRHFIRKQNEEINRNCANFHVGYHFFHLQDKTVKWSSDWSSPWSFTRVRHEMTQIADGEVSPASVGSN